MSEIGEEVVGCNIPVFVYIEKPSSLGFMIKIGDACKECI